MANKNINITECEINPGLVVSINGGRLSNANQNRSIIVISGTLAYADHLYVCVCVDEVNSYWTVLTSQGTTNGGTSRLSLTSYKERDNVSKTDRWFAEETYLADGNNIIFGAKSVIVNVSDESSFPNARRRISAGGVEAILQEIRTRHGLLPSSCSEN
ncbi:MAG: hypothetical protein HQL87_02550 [Magnetococcales bacterium]|nr:hypothetical protein [Magnetococcales bacterium]